MEDDVGNLEIEVTGSDRRGKVFSGKSQGKEQFIIAEIKKGKARGGHYHNIDTFHIILVGTVKYEEKQLDNRGKEVGDSIVERVCNAGTMILTPAYSAHVLTAIQDSIIVEPSGGEKQTINYVPLRKKVENSI